MVYKNNSLFLTLSIIKKLIDGNLNLIELGAQKGELSCPEMIAEPNRKKKDSPSFLVRTQPMKSHGLFVHYCPPNLLFPSIKGFSFPCCGADLHVARHGCRPRISILCWSQINPSLLEKYLAVCLFLVITMWAPEELWLCVTYLLHLGIQTKKEKTLFQSCRGGAKQWHLKHLPTCCTYYFYLHCVGHSKLHGQVRCK